MESRQYMCVLRSFIVLCVYFENIQRLLCLLFRYLCLKMCFSTLSEGYDNVLRISSLKVAL